MPYPQWLLKEMPNNADLNRTGRAIKGLHTVCESAACPNISECFGARHLTFLILGSICTRNCVFCAVTHGVPTEVSIAEADQIVSAVIKLDLTYVVITSVTRDDLADGGAFHFARIVESLRKQTEAGIEVLIPDFSGCRLSLEQVVRAKPDVIGHNLETVKRLQNKIRPQAAYELSLSVLRTIKEMDGTILTKSGLMLGLGEKDAEIMETMQDIRETGCDVLTLGQYRQPGEEQIPVNRFILEEGFEYLRASGLAMGFKKVISGSYVRSSYGAGKIKDLLEKKYAI